jgi:MGT family glycosyltransferase
MSTVCIIGHPAPGHINPTLSVAAELTARGERVIYYATEPFRKPIQDSGAWFRSYGDHELFERNLARGGILGGMDGLLQTTEEILPGFAKNVYRDEPDYLLVEAHALWGNLLAQMSGLPTAILCSMFAINEKLIGPSQLMKHLYGPRSREEVLSGLLSFSSYFNTARRLREKHGVSCPGIIDYLANPQPLTIVFTSREFQVGSNAFDDRYQFVGPSVRASTGEFSVPEGQDPLIYISMGTMYNDEVELYRECFRAFGGNRFRVVISIGHRVDRSKLPQIPANFLVSEYFPQMAVLQAADLFITHGGINSAHEAMISGVPMIVLPQRADHHVVADRVEAVGAGLVLERSRATATMLAELADRVLSNPEFKFNSLQVGKSLRAAGGHQRAVDEIFRFKERRGISRRS